MAGWQSGYAADCNSVYVGSIPVPASKIYSLKSIGWEHFLESFSIGATKVHVSATFEFIFHLFFLRSTSVLSDRFGNLTAM